MDQSKSELAVRKRTIDCLKSDLLRRVRSSPVFDKSRDEDRSINRSRKSSSVSFRETPSKSTLQIHMKPIIRELPKPDCLVQVGSRTMECKKSLLQKYSRTLSQIRFPLYTSVPLVLRTEGKVFAETFWLLYNWMNMAQEGELFINYHWVLELYIAAQFLDIPLLVDQCHKFLTDERLVSEEAAFYLFTKLHRYHDEREIANYLVPLINSCFVGISTSADFLNLYWDEVCQILVSDDIVVSGEVEVFYAGVNWILDLLEEREVYLEEIMSCVRFPYMTVRQMFRICQEFPHFTSKAALKIMLENGVRLSILNGVKDKVLRAKYLSYLPKPRKVAYKHHTQQPESFRMFLSQSRKEREKCGRLYQSNGFLNFEKPPIVAEFKRLYEISKTKRLS